MPINNKKSNKERKDQKVEIRVNEIERKALDRICEQAEMTISELVRHRVLSLTEKEIDALARRSWTTTPYGRILNV